MFRVFFKEKGRSTDVEGDSLGYHPAMRIIMVDNNGKTVAIFNVDEIIGIKILSEGK